MGETGVHLVLNTTRKGKQEQKKSLGFNTNFNLMILSSFFWEERKLLDANFGKAIDECEDEVFRIWTKSCSTLFEEGREGACMCI